MQINSTPARSVDPELRHRQLTRQAQLFVSQTFFGTLLKQVRDSPFRSELFDGGRGGKAFGPLLDQHLAERMSRGAAAPLVRSIVKKLERTGTNDLPRSTHVAPTR